ncbi:STAS domain-containing protein [Amycolatopsis saalfeldensis]|uniref:Anti-anti-sigma factor n=1 Tax=Amycolatopsis saalfeldensis TaxID=394193 RepID=A0A1H8YP48_9PSEU|nr:STAS domain-containing protein [Amycolatopsis saalfeldensis]SEP53926.1 anti-anti-sigma factor [Amycolatopsis saalfeldensis]
MKDLAPSDHGNDMTCTVMCTAESTVVAVTGSLDGTAAGHLLSRLTEEIALRPRALIVDLTRVSFCSAQCLRSLLVASADAHAVGVPCVNVSDQRAVRRPVSLLELDQLLQVHDNVAAARKWLSVVHNISTTNG